MKVKESRPKVGGVKVRGVWWVVGRCGRDESCGKMVGRWLGDLGTARLGGLRLAASQRLGRNQRPLGHTQAHTAVFSDPCLG